MKYRNIELIEEIDIIDEPIWAIWTAEAEDENGNVVFGSVQSDGHTIAEDTFEVE